ncbi:MAG TPA: hypothetical protein PKY73_18315 [Hyphomonas sp.]|nr:hypothetical protein [Hyphomonas sp.]
MAQVLDSILARGDLAHLALFLWAAGASLMLARALREIYRLTRGFDGFVRELARFNRRVTGDD